jgi:hypothetical protein
MQIYKAYCRHLKNSTKKAIERALQVIQMREELFEEFCIQSTVYHRYRWLHDSSILSAWFYISTRPLRNFDHHRIQLSTHPTTMQGASKKSEYREGFLFCIHLSNGVCGYGEVIGHNSFFSEFCTTVFSQIAFLLKYTIVQIQSGVEPLRTGWYWWINVMIKGTEFWMN